MDPVQDKPRFDAVPSLQPATPRPNVYAVHGDVSNTPAWLDSFEMQANNRQATGTPLPIFAPVALRKATPAAVAPVALPPVAPPPTTASPAVQPARPPAMVAAPLPTPPAPVAAPLDPEAFFRSQAYAHYLQTWQQSQVQPAIPQQPQPKPHVVPVQQPQFIPVLPASNAIPRRPVSVQPQPQPQPQTPMQLQGYVPTPQMVCAPQAPGTRVSMFDIRAAHTLTPYNQMVAQFGMPANLYQQVGTDVGNIFVSAKQKADADLRAKKIKVGVCCGALGLALMDRTDKSTDLAAPRIDTYLQQVNSYLLANNIPMKWSIENAGPQAYTVSLWHTPRSA